MSVASITFNRKVDRNVIARMSAVHRRLLSRIKGWNPALQGSVAVQSAHPAEFIRYLLTDPEVDPIDVANALVDLRDHDIVEIEVMDEVAFRFEMENAARAILMERAGLTNAN